MKYQSNSIRYVYAALVPNPMKAFPHVEMGHVNVLARMTSGVAVSEVGMDVTAVGDML